MPAFTLTAFKPLHILTAALLSTTLLVACSQQKPAEPPATDVAKEEATNTESERLYAWFEDLHEEDLARSPNRQTYRGLKTNNDKWTDNSEAATDAYFERARERLAEIQTYDQDALDDAGKLSYKIFKRNQKDALAGEKWRFHRYALTQNGGAHTSRTQLLVNAHSIDSLEDAKAYVTRVASIGVSLANYTAYVKKQSDMGIIVPKFAFPLILGTLDNMLKGQPFEEGAATDSVLLADFKKKIADLEISDEEKAALEIELVKGLLEAYQPSLLAIKTLATAMSEKATDDDGIWKLPDGGDFYNYSLAMMTTTDLTSDEIHQLGLDEVARLHGEMETLIAKMGYKGSLQDYFEFARTDEHFYYADTDEGRQRYVDEAQAAQDRAYAKVPDFFDYPLKDKVEVRPVEKYRENGAPLAFYSGPSRDGTRPGIYYINTKDMKSLPTYQMEAIAFHEGIPGHHYQSSVTQNLEGVPEFQRSSYFYSHGEGWGLYSEYLAHEMDLYRDDESEFGRLTLELWRAMRLVADTGLHAKKWTRQETIDYMVKNSPMDVVNITTEVQRYVTMAGQATTYKIGMNKILELRAHAKEELGDDFDIKGFHSVVLGNGGVPMGILEENVEAWIKDVKSAAR